MRARIAIVTLSLVVSVLHVGCSGDPRPSKSEIEQSLATRVPAFARVTSFSVEAMENIGTKVEPVWHSRFRANIKVTAPTFASDGSEAGVVFVRPVKREGETMEIFGKAASTLYAGTWRTQLSFEGSPIEALGQPASAFGSGKLIVRGTTEETAYLAEQAENQRRAIIASERQAEGQRLAQERARAEEESRHRAAALRLRGLLRPGTVFNGAQVYGTKENRLRLTILSFDPSTGAITAKDEWLNERTNQFGPGNQVVGTVSEDELHFTESVQYDESGKPRREYTLRFALKMEGTSSRLIGECQGTSGKLPAWFVPA